MDQPDQTTTQNDTDAAGSDSSVDATTTPDVDETGVDTANAEGSDTQADGDGSNAGADTGNGEGKSDATPDGAPEQYETFTTPDGYELDETAHAAFQETAKGLNLTQAEAQKLIDYDAKRTQEQTEAAQKQWNETLEGWKTDLKNDETIGGPKYEENLAFANKAIDAFGTPELRTFLDESGLGNHPDLLKAFHKAGSAISEDQLVSGNGGNSATPKRFYNNSNMN